MSLGRTDATQNYLAMNAQGNVSGDPYRANHKWGAAAQVEADTTRAYPVLTWTMITGVWKSASDVSVWANAVAKVRQTASSGTPDFASLNEFCVGSLYSGLRVNFFNGLIAECAAWDEALGEDEIKSLWGMGNPRVATKIRRSALQFYASFKDDLTSEVGVGLNINGGAAYSSTNPTQNAYDVDPVHSYQMYDQLAVSNTVLDVDNILIPDSATHAELQADTQPIRYTMDGATDPSQTSGLILRTDKAPKKFTIGDLRRMRFVRGAASDAALNLHFINGNALV